ncbi:hypothetical protein K466DRAFT_505048 [Polyporus arcularius HHB13444]|uniref:Integrase core domain-containing protein n=1 Tax=Polyporus arcularius HHB13444 TaxID=1314778 RepID=A0A5C3P207_9APHY|nr:hypothetical protein K466DRAFT_505048 [Polyporus arcularius HHB13444]
MEQERGANRGSYIWGRSVHNTRIERLWFDVTIGFGGKWKTFFLELEHYDGLDVDLPAHIWLIHHLFLHAINQDAQEWSAIWNAHGLHIRGEQTASPHELFLFGVAEHGARGLSHLVRPPPEEPIEDIVNYGVDWEVLQDPILMRHHREHNRDVGGAPPANTTVPSHLSEVTCDPPRCPLHVDVVSMLNQHLSHHFDLASRDMVLRRQLWRSALAFCTPWFE